MHVCVCNVYDWVGLGSGLGMASKGLLMSIVISNVPCGGRLELWHFVLFVSSVVVEWWGMILCKRKRSITLFCTHSSYRSV